MSRDEVISRRAFVELSSTIAGGVLWTVRSDNGPTAYGQPRSSSASRQLQDFAPGPFVSLAADGTVTVTVARPEMGQGVRTALPMLIAEELDVPLESVRVIHANADETRYGDQFTGGSAVLRTAWTPLRTAGATARQMLRAAAASQWGVPDESCETEAGAVHHRASGRRVRYEALLDVVAQQPVPTAVTLKSPEQFRIIGQPVPQRDIPAIVTGRAEFGIDVRVPGMLFATVERAVTFDARPMRIDDARARAASGVVTVVPVDPAAMPSFPDNCPKPPHGVAVVAATTWEAFSARSRLQVEWSPGAGAAASSATLAHDARMALRRRPAIVERTTGDVAAALREARHIIDVTYQTPLLAHAPMEPLTCTAHWTTDACEIWAPTQNPADVVEVARRITGLPVSAITVHLIRMGGSFGRRYYSDFVAEALVIARAVGRPVQVVWKREDDMRHDFYRPLSVYRQRAAIGPDGTWTAYTQHLANAARGRYLGWTNNGALVSGAGELEAFDVPVGVVPHVQVGYTAVDSRIPRGQWRAVESSSSVFATQSLVDEVAHHLGRDPLAYQLELLAPHERLPYYERTYDVVRLRRVLELVRAHAAWQHRAPASGGSDAHGARRGRGVAASFANSLYCAIVADVEIRNNVISVTRVFAAVDGGIIVNPLGARAQVEGSINYALSAALRQEITVVQGRVRQRNFQEFPCLRMRQSPTIEVAFVPSREAISGLGEGALPPVAPAVGNAVFNATGIRLRQMPFRLPTRSSP